MLFQYLHNFRVSLCFKIPFSPRMRKRWNKICEETDISEIQKQTNSSQAPPEGPEGLEQQTAPMKIAGHPGNGGPSQEPMSVQPATQNSHRGGTGLHSAPPPLGLCGPMESLI